LPRLQRKLSSHRSLLGGLEAGEKEEWNDVDEKLSSDLTGLTGDFCKAVVLEERTVGVRHLRYWDRQRRPAEPGCQLPAAQQ